MARAIPDMEEVFQSHAGSIEAFLEKRPFLVRSACFNPTLVRLRRWLRTRSSRSGSPVSIPRWFD